MKSVTVWCSKQPDGSWKFNHLEDGWSTQNAPTPHFESQRRSWPGKEWMHVHQYLDDTNMIFSDVMKNIIRNIDELLNMLSEAAEREDYFEIGPEEAKILWAEIQRLRQNCGNAQRRE